MHCCYCIAIESRARATWMDGATLKCLPLPRLRPCPDLLCPRLCSYSFCRLTRYSTGRVHVWSSYYGVEHHSARALLVPCSSVHHKQPSLAAGTSWPPANRQRPKLAMGCEYIWNISPQPISRLLSALPTPSLVVQVNVVTAASLSCKHSKNILGHLLQHSCLLPPPHYARACAGMRAKRK